jgi:hypothetical protein
MLPYGVTIPATVPQRLEIPEGLMNYPVLFYHASTAVVWLRFFYEVSLSHSFRPSTLGRTPLEE